MRSYVHGAGRRSAREDCVRDWGSMLLGHAWALTWVFLQLAIALRWQPARLGRRGGCRAATNMKGRWCQRMRAL
eukprot:1848884-Alexandrium_andersonii.AAC.1